MVRLNVTSIIDAIGEGKRITSSTYNLPTHKIVVTQYTPMLEQISGQRKFSLVTAYYVIP
jgi:hypothetical protein